MDATLGVLLLIVGIVMLIMEVTSPGFFIAIPGTVLVVLGLIGIMWPETFYSRWTPVLIFGIGVPAFILTIYSYKKFGSPEPPTTTSGEGLKGKRGIVTKEVTPDSIKGKVKITGQIWSATSDAPIKEGAKVVVKAYDGAHLVVEEVK